MKIGIIAGAFDPIHNGHLYFIDESIKKYQLDKVLVLIEEKSRFKQSFADFSHRKKIVELSIKDLPKVELYNSESASFPLSSTLPKIRKEYQARLYLLIGDDVEKHIASWPDSKAILGNIELIVADRNQDDKHRRMSSGKVRKQIKAGADTINIQNDALDYCLRNNLYN